MNDQPNQIKVEVLFFGATADEAGARSLELEIRAETRADEAFRQIIAAHPRLAAHKLLFAVNQEYASGEETLNDGDELAVFTAVSGG